MIGKALKENNLQWDCLRARVKETGEVVAVKNLNVFEPWSVPNFVQIGTDGTELRYFSFYELEFQ